MIAINNRHYLEDFVRLNEEWITHYFKLEAPDHALAANPGKIIDDGGYIIALLASGKVIGVCALFNEGNGTYQLARMAVSSAHQGQGHGNRLMLAALDQLNRINARRVYLLSNTKLAAAIALYRKHGFIVLSEGQHPVYARSDITMEKQLATNL